MAEDFIRIPLTTCLECGHRFNGIGQPGTQQTAKPSPGDPIACIRRGAVMTLEDGKLRGFTDAEMDSLIADTETMDSLALLVGRIHFLKHSFN